MPKYLLTLAAALLAVLVLPPSALSAEPLRPASMSFVQNVHAGYLITTARIERIEELSRELYRQLEFITFDVDLRVEEALFGPKPKDNRLVLPPLRVPLNSIRIDGGARDPQAGDVVFVIVAPRDDGSFAWIAPFQFPAFEAANPIKVGRLRKASKILSIQDRRSAAERLRDACEQDEDPVFAEWCVTTLDPRKTRYSRKEEDAVYGPIRAEINVAEYLATLWQLVEEPSTHSLVFVAAVRRLLLGELTEQDRIHEIILRRFSLPLTFTLDDQNLATWDYETHQLLMYVYPELRQIHRDEMLSRMRLLAGNSLEKRCRPLALRYASYLYAPSDEDARRHLLQFYKDFVPIVREDRDLAIPFHYGLKAIMEWEGRHSKEIHWTSLHFARSLLADEQLNGVWPVNGVWPNRLLTGYAYTYRRYHKTSDELSNYLKDILPQVGDVETRSILEKYSKQLRSSE